MSWPKMQSQIGGTPGSWHPPTNPNRQCDNGAVLPPSKAKVDIPQDEAHGLKAKTILKVEIKK